MAKIDNLTCGIQTLVAVVLFSPKVPQALIESSVHLALYSSMLQASTSSVPQAPQKFTAQLFVPLSLLHLLSASVQTARTGKQGFSFCQGSSSLN